MTPTASLLAVLAAVIPAPHRPMHLAPLHADPISAFAHPFGGAEPSVVARGAAADVLASAWCGTVRSTDYTASSVGSLPQFKVVYAHPTGSTDRFGTQPSFRDWLQGDVQAMSDRIAAASGSKETVRFDVGTDCPDPLSYVDVADVQLPQSAAQLQAMSYSTRYQTIAQDITSLAPQLNQTGGIRHYAVYADDTMPPAGDRSGVGAEFPDDFPDPDNRNNGDGQVAVVFGLGTSPTFLPTSGDTTDASDYMLHELTHTLGAVQDSAPHASGASHCWDEHDVMCYADGGPYYQNGGTPQTLCNQTLQAYDCGQDDYFNYAPPPGSYLATHWNAARSTFMCPLTRCDIAGAPPVAKLSIPSSPPSAPLVAWSGAPFVLSATGSTDDSGFSSYEWDTAGYDGRIDQITPSPDLTLTFRDATPGVAAQVKLGVWTVDLDGAFSSAYVQVPVYPPDVLLQGTARRQRLTTARRHGIAYTVYGGGGTVRITGTVTSSVARRLHLSSRTLGRTRVLPAGTQLAGHLRMSAKVARLLAAARSVRVTLRAVLTPIGAGERGVSRSRSVTLR